MKFILKLPTYRLPYRFPKLNPETPIDVLRKKLALTKKWPNI